MPQGTRNESCGHIRKWTSVLWARVQLQDVRKSDQRLNSKMWDIAPRNGTLDSNAGRNVKRSADVWGNARHFCDGELNFTPEFNYRIREKALRNESLETNNARDCLQSCGYLSKWTSFLPFRVQLRMWDIQPKKINTPKKEPPFSLWRFFSFTIFIFD